MEAYHLALSGLVIGDGLYRFEREIEIEIGGIMVAVACVVELKTRKSLNERKRII